MRSHLLLLAAGSAVFAAPQDKPADDALTTGKKGDAPFITDSPAGRAVIARFAPSDKSPLAGSVLATAGPNGLGTAFTVNFRGLDKAKGPYAYHIHAAKVAEDGNCDSTKAHLDPFERGQKPPCDPTRPQTCEVGDLAGKWGKILDKDFSASYLDPFVSLNNENVANAAELSIVVHNVDGDRIACTNFVDLYALLDDCNANPTKPPKEKPTEPKPGDTNEKPKDPTKPEEGKDQDPAKPGDSKDKDPAQSGTPTDKNDKPKDPTKTGSDKPSDSDKPSESATGGSDTPTGTDGAASPTGTSAKDPSNADAPDAECGVQGPNGEPATVCDGAASSLTASLAAAAFGLAIVLLA